MKNIKVKLSLRKVFVSHTDLKTSEQLLLWQTVHANKYEWLSLSGKTNTTQPEER